MGLRCTQIRIARDVDTLRVNHSQPRAGGATSLDSVQPTSLTPGSPATTVKATVLASTTTDGDVLERVLKDVRADLRTVRRAMGDLARDVERRAQDAVSFGQAGQVCVHVCFAIDGFVRQCVSFGLAGWQAVCLSFCLSFCLSEKAGRRGVRGMEEGKKDRERICLGWAGWAGCIRDRDWEREGGE